MDFGLKIVWLLNQICALIHYKGQLSFQSKSKSCKPKFSLALQVQRSIPDWWGIVWLLRYLCCGLCDCSVTTLLSTALRVGFGHWSTEDFELCYSSSSSCSKAPVVSLGDLWLHLPLCCSGPSSSTRWGCWEVPLIIQQILWLPKETATQCSVKPGLIGKSRRNILFL